MLKTDCVHEIRGELVTRADEKYRIFNESLIPGCGKTLGVRLPMLRTIAESYAAYYSTDRSRFDEYASYILSGAAEYQEEVLVYGLSFSYLKVSIETVLGLLDAFMPYDTNWAINDSVCTSLHIIRKNREYTWQFLQPYLENGKTYYMRMAFTMMLCHFAADDTYVSKIVGTINCIKENDDYYSKMAAAWCLSVYYVKYPDLVMPYLEHNSLDDETFNKAVQKIVESYRCPENMKKKIQSLKRNNRQPAKGYAST
jgi:3-methyladenine DNA glycosylase AlkD